MTRAFMRRAGFAQSSQGKQGDCSRRARMGRDSSRRQRSPRPPLEERTVAQDFRPVAGGWRLCDPGRRFGSKNRQGAGRQAPESLRLRVGEGLATALRLRGKADQAKALDAKLDSLIVKGYDEHNKKDPFPIEKFKGRKGKSKRAVLVELFTGRRCPPCVAADLGFDALAKAFKPSEVVLLQYHLHIPGPDPLTNTDTEARQEFYGRAIRGTPAIMFNGKAEAPGGGARDDAEDFFQKYHALVEKHLEKDTGLEVTASAVRKDDKVHIQASVKNIESPSKDLRLRLALVEDWARYQGRNGMIYHHRVVRVLPGGADGMALTKKDAEKSVVVDLERCGRSSISISTSSRKKKGRSSTPSAHAASRPTCRRLRAKRRYQ